MNAILFSDKSDLKIEMSHYLFVDISTLLVVVVDVVAVVVVIVFPYCSRL